MCRSKDVGTVEIADLLRQFGPELGSLCETRRKVIRDLIACRTEALGGHRYCCGNCGHCELAYNSCCNRHCPKCQSLAGARWLEARLADLLPIPYFHAVFTVPHELHPIFLGNRSACYNLLFAAVSETLQEVAQNPKRLGADIGITAILHTWTQKLHYHPHLHCIVSGGGLSVDGQTWAHGKQKFLLPVKALSLVFRGKLLHKIEAGFKSGSLLADIKNPLRLLQQAAHKNWVVYLKPPMAGPEQVLSYLGRYTHKIAISNHRILGLDGDQITFSWRDRRDGNTRKLQTEPVVAFLKRFLLHVVPKRFVRIRHFGFLANSIRSQRLALCRKLLGAPQPQKTAQPESWQDLVLRLTGQQPLQCPACKQGQLVEVAVLPAQRPP